MTDWRDTTFEVRPGPPEHGGFGRARIAFRESNIGEVWV